MSIHQPNSVEAELQNEFESHLRRLYFKFAHLYSLMSDNQMGVTMSSYNTHGGPFQTEEEGLARFMNNMDRLIDFLLHEDGSIHTVTNDQAYETTDGFLGVKDEIKLLLAYAERLPQTVVNILLEVLGDMVFFEAKQIETAEDENLESETRIPSAKEVMVAALIDHRDFLSSGMWGEMTRALGILELDQKKTPNGEA